MKIIHNNYYILSQLNNKNVYSMLWYNNNVTLIIMCWWHSYTIINSLKYDDLCKIANNCLTSVIMNDDNHGVIIIIYS